MHADLWKHTTALLECTFNVFHQQHKHYNSNLVDGACCKAWGHRDELTAPISFLPFAMSTICRAMSSPQRAWASFVLAPRWGQLMTLGCLINEWSLGGSCIAKHNEDVWFKRQSDLYIFAKSIKQSQSHLNKDVEPSSSTLPWLQGSEESWLIDDASSCTVYNFHSFLAFSKGLIIKQTLEKKKQLKKYIYSLQFSSNWADIFAQLYS